MISALSPHYRKFLDVIFIPGAFFVKCACSLCVYVSFFPQLKSIRLKNFKWPACVLSVYVEALRQTGNLCFSCVFPTCNGQMVLLPFTHCMLGYGPATWMDKNRYNTKAGSYHIMSKTRLKELLHYTCLHTHTYTHTRLYKVTISLCVGISEKWEALWL